MLMERRNPNGSSPSKSHSGTSTGKSTASNASLEDETVADAVKCDKTSSAASPETGGINARFVASISRPTCADSAPVLLPPPPFPVFPKRSMKSTSSGKGTS